MRSALASVANRRAGRQRSGSLSTVPPARTSSDFLPELASTAASIVYKSPLPAPSGLPLYIVNAAALPDTFEVDYDGLLPYVLARLPGEDELLGGTEYEVVFFAGGQPDGATKAKKHGPGMGWYLQAYHVLSRAMRKRLKQLYIVHPRSWVRVLISVFSTVVSPKFRRKILHINTLTALASHLEIENLLIPPAVYLHDRRLETDIDLPYSSGRRAFGARHALPRNIETRNTRLPRVVRETTSFILMPHNIQTEGLFRIPPHSVLAEILKEAYDRGQKFIVWKEKDATFVQPGIRADLAEEVKIEDGFGVHLAASLVKAWYRNLREPLFPESSYNYLRQKYGHPDVKVIPEDLVELLLPASEISPLTSTSREILIRHLLPLLSLVAAAESDNKMNPENLAICFAMALVCGSNQLEDARMTSVIRRVLQAATNLWPELRQGLGISEDAFWHDLSSPADSRDYEDPPQETRLPEINTADESPRHRIVLTDGDDAVNQGDFSPADTAEKDSPIQDATSAPLITKESLTPAVPKRKPAPKPDIVTSVDSPPRGAVSTTEGLHGAVSESPGTYDDSHADDFDFPTDGSEPRPRSRDAQLSLKVPKRKALTTDQTLDPAAPARPANKSATEDAGLLARMAAQQGAQGLARDAANSLPSIDGDAQGDGIFRKPSWPASAMRLDPKAPTMPKPRTPSPSLLKRMTSFETTDLRGARAVSSGAERADDLGVSKASVDDLRKLYEERLNMAGGDKADTGRSNGRII